MSTDLVEQINARLREEIRRIGLTLAAAARAAGEVSPQRIKDVVSGKQRCPVDLLSRLDGAGVDTHYVLTGRREPSCADEGRPSPAAENALLQAFRAASPSGRKALLAMSLALAEKVEGTDDNTGTRSE